MGDGRVLTYEFYHHTAAFYGISVNGGDITYLISRNALAVLGNYVPQFINMEGIFSR